MSGGMLKLTDEKISFTHNKSGKRELVKAEEVETVNWRQGLAGAGASRCSPRTGTTASPLRTR